MSAFTDLGKHLTLAASFLNQSALPAADPPPSSASTAPEKNKVTTWSSPLLYKEIGKIEATVEEIDKRSIDRAEWKEKRESALRFCRSATGALEKEPDQQTKDLLGDGLSANYSALKLYLDTLTQRAATPASSPNSAGSLQGPGLVGVYPAGDFIGNREAARALRKLYQEQPIASPELNQLITSGLDKIANAENPDKLARDLRPEVDKIIGGLSKLAPGQPNDRVQKTKNLFAPFLQRSTGERHAFEAGPSAPTASSEPTTAWLETVNAEAAKDMTPRLQEGAKLGHLARTFFKLAENQQNLDQFKESARLLSEHFRKEDPALSRKLQAISEVKNLEELKKLDRDVFDPLYKATARYQEEKRSAEKK